MLRLPTENTSDREENIMPEWITTTLEECTDILGDGLHGTPKYTENGEYAFVNGNNLVDGEILIKKETKRVDYSQYDKYKKPLTNRTILVSINGTLGNVGVYGSEKIILGKSACYFNVKESVDKDFIYYIVSSPTFKQYLESNATGTTIKNISLKQMREYTFDLPEIGEQKRISSVLRKIDEKIKNNRAINNNLEQQAQAIFKSWFIDFEPFNKTMPSDWIIGTIDDLAKEVVCGKTPSTKKAEYYGSNIPFITIPDMHGKTYAVTTERYLSKLGANSQIKKSLPKNSICVSCIGTAGLVTLVAEESQTNQQINSIIPKDGFSPYYIYLLMQRLSDTINKLGQSGSTIVNLNKSQFGKIQVIIPALSVMIKFDKIVSPMFEKMLQNQMENLKLTSLRDALLPRLMSGELDVSDIEI